MLGVALLAGCSTAKPDVSVDRHTSTVSSSERTSGNPTTVVTTTRPAAQSGSTVSVRLETPAAPPSVERQAYSQTVEADSQVAAAPQQTAKPELASADREFALEAARAGQKEVQLGNVAAKQASVPAVRDFAQQMVSDHGAAHEELKTVASTLGVQLPAADPAPASGLSGLTGAQFDQAYVSEMVSAHEQAVALFERQANGGTNQALKDFAAAKLPTLRHHLEMAQALQSAPATE